MSIHARTLRLRAHNPRDARRARGEVEAALSMASLAIDRRMYVVRHFDVGKVVIGERSWRLSRTVERRFAECRAEGKHASEHGAASGNVVWFRDAAESLEFLLLRLWRGAPTREWYWPSVLRALGLTGQRPHLPAVLAACATHPYAPALVARSVAQTLRLQPDAAIAVLRQVPASQLYLSLGLPPRPFTPGAFASIRWTGDGLLRLESAHHAAASAGFSDIPAPLTLSFVPERTPVVLRALQSWGPDAERLGWLAAVTWLERSPSLGNSPSALIRRVTTPQSTSSPHDAPRRGAQTHPPSAHHAHPASPASPSYSELAPPTSSTHQPPRIRAERNVAAPPPFIPHHDTDPEFYFEAVTPHATNAYGTEPSPTEILKPSRAMRPASAAAVDTEYAVGNESPEQFGVGPNLELDADLGWTEAGGLPFLIRVLCALDIGETLENCDAIQDAGVMARVLVELARMAKVPPEDALCRALTSLFGPAPEVDFQWVAPANGRVFVTTEAQREPADEAVSTEPLNELVCAFARACERYCREELGLPLQRIVQRRGRLFFTANHLDIVFALNDADVELRIAGLDVNPGWVGWLGRIVTFHYREGGAGLP